MADGISKLASDKVPFEVEEALKNYTAPAGFTILERNRKTSSILHKYGVLIVDGDGIKHWQCLANDACRAKGNTIKCSSNTSAASEHMAAMHKMRSKVSLAAVKGQQTRKAMRRPKAIPNDPKAYKCKIFFMNPFRSFEHAINLWLHSKSDSINILSIKQSYNTDPEHAQGGYSMVSVWYKDKLKGEVSTNEVSTNMEMVAV